MRVKEEPNERHILVNTMTVKNNLVSPVWQFICLLAPTVLTGFYLVYALVGLFIDGKSKLKWSDEAMEVGLRVTMIIVVMNVLVMLYALYHKLALRHVLWLSPIAHVGIAVLLTIMITFTVI